MIHTFIVAISAACIAYQVFKLCFYLWPYAVKLAEIMFFPLALTIAFVLHPVIITKHIIGKVTK